MVKVSVVIPTYNNSKERLNRLLESLNNQTLSPALFEVIFIDDGSNDLQSYKRLKDLTKQKENYIVRRIKPSGWASRPRNIGTKIANGEYIFFSDDDDTLFPQALERMYNFAHEHDLDVVNPKIIRTKGWSWGWDHFKENVVGAEVHGIQSMGPMTVPKLYRRDFLINNDLFFSEKEKAWWEDVMFSCLVFSKNPKIGILADYPVYHWREQNRSASFGHDLEHKWNQLNNVASYFYENLSEIDRDTMIEHWYLTRVLGAIRNSFHKKEKATQNFEFLKAKEWKKKYVNNNVTSKLDSYNKILDYLLELNDKEKVILLSSNKEENTARSYLDNIYFEQDKITVECTTQLKNENEDIQYKGNPKQPKLNLPKEILKALPKNLNKVDEIEIKQAEYKPIIKGRISRATWEINDVTKSRFYYEKTLSGFKVYANLIFNISLEKFIVDNEDKYQPYDIATRLSYLDNFSQRALACEDKFKKAAIINGNTYVVYKNKSELLSIDLNSTILNFFSVAKINTEKAEDDKNKIIFPIENVHVFNDSEINILASIYNNNNNSECFVETDGKIVTKNNNAYLEINHNNLTGDCTIHLAIGQQSHEFTISI